MPPILGANETSSGFGKKHLLAPYGLYYEAKQNDSLVKAATQLAVEVLTSLVMNKVVIPRVNAVAGRVAQSDFYMKFCDKVMKKLPIYGLLERFGLVAQLPSLAARALVSQVVGRLKGKAFDDWRNGCQGAAIRQAAGRAASMGQDFPEGAGADALKSAFPRGFFPPRMQAWTWMAVERYARVDDWERSAAGPDGVVALDGVVRVDRLSSASDRPLAYRGNGVLHAVGAPGDEGERPCLERSVGPADGDRESYFTLAYEHPEKVPAGARAGQLSLGPSFRGSVYSTHGIRPAGPEVKVLGNLVCERVNKSVLPSGKVEVFYDRDRLPGATGAGAAAGAWHSIRLSPKVAAFHVGD
jgi:hypothetical protein